MQNIFINMIDKEEMLKFLSEQTKHFIIDNFQTTEQISSSANQTAEVLKNLHSLKLVTGQQEGSEAYAYYKSNIFNPHFSTLQIKLHFNDIKNILAYVGFKESLNPPRHDMTENHSGLLIYNNRIYFSTGLEKDGISKYKNTLISDIDLTKWVLIEIKNQYFRWYFLPYRVPYFNGFTIEKYRIGLLKKWSLTYSNSDTTPKDSLYYIYFYIKNLTGENKEMEISKVVYFEDYVD
jgi:hypothetical protein